MIINLTPHPIRVRLEDGKELSFPPSGQIARVVVKERDGDSIDGIPCVFNEYGQPEGLPEPKAGHFYIVSLLVFQSCPERQDLLVPDTGKTCIRDEHGNIIAVRRFVRRRKK